MSEDQQWSPCQTCDVLLPPAGPSECGECGVCNICVCCLSEAVCDESGAGGAVVAGHALLPLQAHGVLPVYRLGVRHHHLQDAVPAERGQPRRVLSQLQHGEQMVVPASCRDLRRTGTPETCRSRLRPQCGSEE